MADDKHDVEDAAVNEKTQASVRGRAFYEAAFLLTFWSILVMNEGVVRFVQHGQPAAKGLFVSNGKDPMRFVGAFLGGLFECIFGLVGLVVGLAAAIFDYHTVATTKIAMAIQVVLGWYVFIDYVFVIPAFRAANLADPMFNGALTLGESKFVIVLGILTSVAFCLALQGGQFVFFARLIAFDSGSDFLKQRTGARMRAIFWNGNLLLAGLWATIQGALIIHKVGGNVLAKPFMAPPNVGKVPGLLLFTGLLMFLWPLIGIAISAGGKHGLVRSYVAFSVVVFLFIWLNYTIVQLGILGGPAPAAGSAMHSHLVFMVCFLGPYFMLKWSEVDSNSASA